jgi:hypothetical protein
MSLLTKSEKIQIVNSHIRALESNKYNIELDILKEESKSEQNTTLIESLNSSKTLVDNQILVLLEELARVQEIVELEEE